jgi:hypothetical protein
MESSWSIVWKKGEISISSIDIGGGGIARCPRGKLLTYKLSIEGIEEVGE